MTRVVYRGRARLKIPDGWTEFTWRSRRYRLNGPTVEFWSLARQGWVPSICLTTAAPKGRAA